MVIITGSNGFTGHYLSKYIKENKLAEVIIGIDLMENSKNRYIDFYFSNSKLEEVIAFVNIKNCPVKLFHLAANLGKVPISDLIYSNVFWTSKFIEMAFKINKLKCFLNIGSSGEYGIQSEKYIGENCIPNPVTEYGLSKHLQTQLVMLIKESHFDIVCTRTFNILGPGLGANLVIGKMIKEFFRASNSPNKTINMGRLDSVRDFIDIRDLVRVYWRLSDVNSRKEIFNVASGNSYSLSYIFALCSNIFKIPYELPKPGTNNDPSDLDSQYADITKLKKYFDFKNNYSVENSIADMIEHFKKNNSEKLDL